MKNVTNVQSLYLQAETAILSNHREGERHKNREIQRKKKKL